MRAFAAALALLLLAGCSGGGDAWSQSRDAISVDPGGEDHGEEINLELKQGDVIHWDWTSTGDVKFNIHAHRDGHVLDLVGPLTARAHSGTYTADVDGIFSFFWWNDGSKIVQLTYDVGGDGKKLG